jgi:uncharacterized pyridoxamine 5'-phosphate oxidase family protein
MHLNEDEVKRIINSINIRLSAIDKNIDYLQIEAKGLRNRRKELQSIVFSKSIFIIK